MNNKLLILIKAHSSNNANYYNTLYENLTHIWKQYMNSNLEVDCYFLMGNNNLETEYKIEKNILWIKQEENYWDALLTKVLKGLKYFFNDNKYEYKNVFITNLSTFVNIDELLKKTKNIDENICYAITGTYKFKNVDYLFPSGAGALFSRKIIKNILNATENINFENYPSTDDIFFGKLLFELNVPILNLDRNDILNENINLENLSLDHIHYRVKYDNNREKEKDVHLFLLKRIYGIV